ncbi:MAG: 30S ribosomal protein S20 [Nitrospinae bacterium]|nr:30S ribosomal protein S20 [Nitrospinota bacterium]
MPNHKSAEKRDRQNKKRKLRNTVARASARTAVKKARTAIDAGQKEEGFAALKEAMKTLQTAASKGVIHKNNAARRISRLAQKLATAGK